MSTISSCSAKENFVLLLEYWVHKYSVHRNKAGISLIRYLVLVLAHPYTMPLRNLSRAIQNGMTFSSLTAWWTAERKYHMIIIFQRSPFIEACCETAGASTDHLSYHHQFPIGEPNIVFTSLLCPPGCNSQLGSKQDSGVFPTEHNCKEKKDPFCTLRPADCFEK